MEESITPIFEVLSEGISPKRLIEEIAYPMMICPSCNMIFWNPQVCTTPKCGLTLCLPCIKQVREKVEVCSKCQLPSKYEPNYFLLSQLNPLKFLCRNAPKCNDIIQYEEVEYNICPLDVIKCPTKDCNWKGARIEVEDHIPTCPGVLITCTNERCELEISRREIPEHKEQCLFEVRKCSYDCGFRASRREMLAHERDVCVLTQIECKYKGRGCNVQIIRSEYENHIYNCEYQPQELECGHEVNMRDVEVHILQCSQYPIVCEDCSYSINRGELSEHKCLPFLQSSVTSLGKTLIQQKDIISSQATQIRTAVDRINTLELHVDMLYKYNKQGKMEVKNSLKDIEDNFQEKLIEQREYFEQIIRDGRRIDREKYISETLILCTECNKLKANKSFRECKLCENNICDKCSFRCSKCSQIYCFKCQHPHICNNCSEEYCSCSNLSKCKGCDMDYCECIQLAICSKCNNNYCKCFPFVICAYCSISACKNDLRVCTKCKNNFCECAKHEECMICHNKYCGQCHITTCLGCQLVVCRACSLFISEYTICIPCQELGNNTKIELFPVFASSIWSNTYQLVNVLYGDNTYWRSKSYGYGCHPSALDYIILRAKSGYFLINKLKVRVQIGYDFDKMSIYIGMNEENLILYKTMNKAENIMEVLFPQFDKVKFIKLVFQGCKDWYFDIYEVKAFGIQL